MSDAELKQFVNAFILKNGQALAYLYDRWRDEKEYEDWKDYDAKIREICVGFDVIKVIKVGVVFKHGEHLVELKVTARSFATRVTKAVPNGK